MTWSVARSVRALFTQADRLWPGRSTASDGTIGNAEHAARTSDHNPDDYPGQVDVRDDDKSREVHAGDLTHDPAHGVDCELIFERIRQRVLAGEEKRVAYLIWRGRIFNPDVSREWRPYKGPNPHDHHGHLSIRYSNAAEDDTSPWFPWADPKVIVQQPPAPAPVAGRPPQERAVLRLILGGSMAVFLSEADEERAFIRHLYLTHLGRPPESFEAIEWWRLELHAKGGDMVIAGISDSDEAVAYRAALVAR